MAKTLGFTIYPRKLPLGLYAPCAIFGHFSYGVLILPRLTWLKQLWLRPARLGYIVDAVASFGDRDKLMLEFGKELAESFKTRGSA